MLVISRKTSESIMIGDDIEIVVTEIGAERVRIGIKAPKGVPILRKELLETREMNREAAAQCGVPPQSGPAVLLGEKIGSSWRESLGRLPAAGGVLPHAPPDSLVGGGAAAPSPAPGTKKK